MARSWRWAGHLPARCVESGASSGARATLSAHATRFETPPPLPPLPRAQHNGGQPIGLAFWINGQLSDWDPTYVVYDNETDTNTTVSRSLHPCTDRAELSAIGAPDGVNTSAGGLAPSVRAPRRGRAAAPPPWARVATRVRGRAKATAETLSRASSRTASAHSPAAPRRAGVERGVPAGDGQHVCVAH
jgi:hypothetical protein